MRPASGRRVVLLEEGPQVRGAQMWTGRENEMSALLFQGERAPELLSTWA